MSVAHYVSTNPIIKTSTIIAENRGTSGVTKYVHLFYDKYKLCIYRKEMGLFSRTMYNIINFYIILEPTTFKWQLELDKNESTNFFKFQGRDEFRPKYTIKSELPLASQPYVYFSSEYTIIDSCGMQFHIENTKIKPLFEEAKNLIRWFEEIEKQDKEQDTCKKEI